MRRISIPGGVLVVAVIAMVAAVGLGNLRTEKKVSAEEGRHYVVDALRARAEGAGTVAPWYRTLDETLPNVDYRRPDGPTHTVTDVAAVGRFVSVEKGVGFTIPGCTKKKDRAVGTCDAPGGTPSDFDNPDALWWTVHATVAVERAIGSSGTTPDRLRIALPLDDPGKFDHMAAGLPALGRAVFFLEANSPLVEHDPSLYVVSGDHTLIATVAGDGTLALPLVHEDKAAELLTGVTRLGDLEARGSARRTIPLRPGPGPRYHERAA